MTSGKTTIFILRRGIQFFGRTGDRVRAARGHMCEKGRTQNNIHLFDCYSYELTKHIHKAPIHTPCIHWVRNKHEHKINLCWHIGPHWLEATNAKAFIVNLSGKIDKTISIYEFCAHWSKSEDVQSYCFSFVQSVSGHQKSRGEMKRIQYIGWLCASECAGWLEEKTDLV